MLIIDDNSLENYNGLHYEKYIPKILKKYGYSQKNDELPMTQQR